MAPSGSRLPPRRGCSFLSGIFTLTQWSGRQKSTSSLSMTGKRQSFPEGSVRGQTTHSPTPF
jgi:hypothetical protein